MERRKSSIASAMVLFVVVFLCITVFALLTILTARADLVVAGRYADHVAEVYACRTRGQETAAVIASMAENGGMEEPETLPEGCEINGDEITITTRENGIECFIRMELTDHGAEIVGTRVNTMWQEDNGLNLWS